MKYPKYPKYKDSGIEWIGEIPETWCESKVRYIASYLNGFAFKPEDWHGKGIPIIRIQNLTDLEANYNYTMMEVPKQYYVKKGDILLSWSASLGVFQWERDFDAWLNQHIFKVKIRKDIVTQSYFLWLATWFIGNLKEDAHGSTMQHLTWDKFASFKIVLPPVEEQIYLGSFLDSENEKLNSIIFKHQQLIEILKEKRQAVITHAVTKGLDPNVPMKDSGIEWIGKIPEHWRVIRLKSATILNPPKSEIKGYSGDTPVSFFPMESIGDDGKLEPVHFRPISKVMNGYTYFRNGDVVVAKITPCFENGKGAIMEGLESGLGFGTTELIVIRPSPILTKSFLYFLTITGVFRNLGEGAMQGAAGQKRVPEEFVSNFKFGLPPLAEQIQISDHTKIETYKIDTLISKQQQMIELLKERKTSLISQAVTGKIDVRGLVLEAKDPAGQAP